MDAKIVNASWTNERLTFGESHRKCGEYKKNRTEQRTFRPNGNGRGITEYLHSIKLVYESSLGNFYMLLYLVDGNGGGGSGVNVLQSPNK